MATTRPVSTPLAKPEITKTIILSKAAIAQNILKDIDNLYDANEKGRLQEWLFGIHDGLVKLGVTTQKRDKLHELTIAKDEKTFTELLKTYVEDTSIPKGNFKNLITALNLCVNSPDSKALNDFIQTLLYPSAQTELDDALKKAYTTLARNIEVNEANIAAQAELKKATQQKLRHHIANISTKLALKQKTDVLAQKEKQLEDITKQLETTKLLVQANQEKFQTELSEQATKATLDAKLTEEIHLKKLTELEEKSSTNSTALTKKLIQSESLATTLQNQLAVVNARIEELLKGQHKEENDVVSDLRRKLANEEKSSDQLRQKNGLLTLERNTANADKAALEKKLTESKQSIAALNIQISALAANENSSKKALADLKIQMQNKIANKDAQLETQSDALQRKETEYTTLKAKSTHLEEKLAISARNLNALQLKLASTESDVITLQRQITDIKQANEVSLQIIRADLLKAQKELSTERKNAIEKQKEVNELKQIIAALDSTGSKPYAKPASDATTLKRMGQFSEPTGSSTTAKPNDEPTGVVTRSKRKNK